MSSWPASTGQSSRTGALTFRYSRKRLDNTIEDMAITDNLGFYIGNPGTQDSPTFCIGRSPSPAPGSGLPTVPTRTGII